MLHIVLAFVALQPFIKNMLAKELPAPSEPKVEKKREVIISLMRPEAAQPKPDVVDVPKLSPAEEKEIAQEKEAEEKEKEKEEIAKEEPAELEKVVPRFTRTSDEQLQGVAENAKLQGERDTIAASNAAANANAPDRAASKGDSKYKDRDELVDTTYQDGLLENMNLGADGKPTSPTPPMPPSEDAPTKDKPTEAKVADQPDLPQPNLDMLAEKDEEEIMSSVEQTPELGDALDSGELATTDKNVEKFLDTIDKSLDRADEVLKNLSDLERQGLAEQEDTIANEKVDPDAMKQMAETEKRRARELAERRAAQMKVAANKSKKGFRSEAKATVVEGSIFRQSNKASANVKATPLGKYMAEVSKRVENEWQKRCMMHADLIQPGSVRMSFVVMPTGQVKHTRTMSRMSGSEAQFNLTYQAINSVKLPPMPAAVKKIQEGDPIEFRYSFSF